MRANRWGIVIDPSVVVDGSTVCAVRMSGDGATDSYIDVKNTDYTPVAGHKVLLADTGGGWVIVCQLGAI